MVVVGNEFGCGGGCWSVAWLFLLWLGFWFVHSGKREREIERERGGRNIEKGDTFIFLLYILMSRIEK